MFVTILTFFIAEYWSEQKDVIRPLKFIQLHGKCRYNPAAMNIYAKDIYHMKTNFSDKVAMEIFEHPANYDYFKNPVISVGKLCDAEVDIEAFRKGLRSLG